MSGKGQISGRCGHKKGCYDNHDYCLRCAGCTTINRCGVCSEWNSETWDRAQRVRTYASKKPSSSSSSGKKSVVHPPLPPHVPATRTDSVLSAPKGSSRWDVSVGIGGVINLR